MKNTIKILVSTTLLLVGSNSLLAEETMTKKELCLQFHDLSSKIMRIRQNGVPITTVITAEGMEKFEDLVIAAYKLPKYHTDENQAEAVVDFGNTVYLACIENLGTE